MGKFIKILFLFVWIANYGQVSQTVAQLKTRFDATAATDLARQQALADMGNMGDGYYFDVTPYVLMFQATGQDSYMDTAMDLWQRRMDASGLASTFYAAATDKTNFFNDSYYTFVCDGETSANKKGTAITGQCQGYYGEISLNEMRGMRTVARMLWVLSNSPTYLAKGTNQTKYNTQLAWFRTNVVEKWWSRGTGYLYRGYTHMAAHWAQIGWFLYEITGEQFYRDAYEQISYSGIVLPTKYAGDNIRSNLREEAVTGGNAYNWAGKMVTLTGSNDISHANSEVELMALGAEHSDYWTLTDMDKLIRAFDQRIFKVDTWSGQSYYISGSGSWNAYWNEGWVRLGMFDQTLQNRMSLKDDPASTSYQVNAWLGSLAYNQAYIDGTLYYPEAPGGGDTTAPVVDTTYVYIDEGNRFKVWTELDEYANYKIDYGTSTGVYTESTTEELTFNYFRHRQWVGGNNAPLLTPGTTYYYRFDMEDASANQAFSSEYTYTTQGNSIPVITLTGAEIIEVDVGTTYTEQGAVWTDVEDGTGSATVGGDTVNVNTIGTYVVTYNYTDTNTNAAPEITRTVNVVQPFTEISAPKSLRGVGSSIIVTLYFGGWLFL